ncbi:hypothetical protein BGZ83_006593 [Gryganskiella cystojenkinii]|nr:hypothetical protein BGZ83_006593 [Gryganskiella cystojenkinii]
MYHKDHGAVKRVQLWLKEIEDKGGKTMFVEDATLTGFTYWWRTKFSAEAKDITPIKKSSKAHNSVYLFTLLVKDKEIHQKIPDACMASESESWNRLSDL